MQANELLSRIQLRARVEALIEVSAGAPSGVDIAQECLSLAEMLIEKNALYGDSALNPNRIFSKADAVEQIRVRIDDKLNRLMKGAGVEDEDVVQDLIGYLILLRIAARRNVEEKVQAYSPYLSGPITELTADEPDPAMHGNAAHQSVRNWWQVKGVVPPPVEDWKVVVPAPVELPAQLTPEARALIQAETSGGELQLLVWCQACEKFAAEPGQGVCNDCYAKRFGRARVDLSHVQG